MVILITGGAGFIGTHTCIELVTSGHEIIVIDNLINSKEESLKRVENITGKPLKFYKMDLLDREKVEQVFINNDIEAVIHFAGLKAVGESIKIPLQYYYNNITGTIILCEVMKKFNVKKMVFSSSATVYGPNNISPLTEDLPLSATNPYGRTKLMIEEILRDIYISDNSWSIAILRYFNPIGAHESGLIGEDPNGTPNNLMPYITQVAAGIREKLSIFGNDYDTYDGTGIRDYIHVVDLAKGHVKALQKVLKDNIMEAYNLGAGKGFSVMDIIKTFEKVNSIKIPYIFTERRKGDIDVCYSNSEKGFRDLQWKAEKNLEDMCKDAWNWQSNNPNGYERGTNIKCF